MHDKPRKTQLPLQRSAMCIASGNLSRFLVFLFSEAPAGRHVYRQATCLATQAPAGRHVCRIGLMYDKSRKTSFRSRGAQCGGGTSIHTIVQVQLID